MRRTPFTFLATVLVFTAVAVLLPTAAVAQVLDADNDGLTEEEESEKGTSPLNPDSDGDNVSDGPNDPDGVGSISAGPDNCPMTSNPSQNDAVPDGTGDECDDDDDNDGTDDVDDAFPTDPTEQSDEDEDGTGDNADTDDDNDGLSDAGETVTSPTDPDSDDDTVSDGSSDPDGTSSIKAGPDNCPITPNPMQTDADEDGIGDACEPPDSTPPDPVIMRDLPAFTLEEPFEENPSGIRPYRVLFDVDWHESSDAGTGVRDYNLWFKKSSYPASNFGPYEIPQGWDPTEQTESSFVGTQGNTLCFKVKARDNANPANESEFGDRTCTAIPIDDTTMNPDGYWAIRDDPDTYLDDFSVSWKRGSFLWIDVLEARHFALVVTKCPQCGRIEVKRYAGGRYVPLGKGTYSLRRDKGVKKSVLMDIAHFDKPKSGTIVVEVVSRKRRVPIEGLGVSKV
jgi:hypothetical protein